MADSPDLPWGNMYQSVWVGETRLSWGLVNQFREIPGFGRLPVLEVFGGAIVQGARARLVRSGAVVAEDLRVGTVIREKIIGTRLEAVDKTIRKCAVATGYQHFQFGDHLELYTRANDARLDPALVPPYQGVPADQERLLGQAEVREVASGSLAGPVTHVTLTRGRLTVGARIRVVRDGERAAEALRLLFLTDGSGRMVSELAAGADAALYLGLPGLRPGDAVQAYEVPLPPWTEVRHARLQAIKAHQDGPASNSWIRRLDYGSLSRTEPAAGQRARVLRDGVVIADGLTIGYLVDDGLVANIARSAFQGNLRDALRFGLDFPYLKDGDDIEVYQLFSRSRPTQPQNSPT